MLREYHATMGALIIEHEGTLDRFAGDGIMLFFNDPLPVPDAAQRAAAMALAMQAQFRPLRDRWSKQGYDLELGIGIAQGLRRWARSASRGASTTRRSAASSTLRPGCAARPVREKCCSIVARGPRSTTSPTWRASGRWR